MTKFTFIFQKAVNLSDLSLRTFSKKWSKQTPAKSSTLLCWYYFSVFWNSSLTNSNHTYVHSILWYYSLFNSNQWKWGEAKKDPSWDFNRDPPWLFTSIVILFFFYNRNDWSPARQERSFLWPALNFTWKPPRSSPPPARPPADLPARWRGSLEWASPKEPETQVRS